MVWTMEDFQREYVKKYFPRLTAQEQAEAMMMLPPEQREELLKSFPADLIIDSLLASMTVTELLAALSTQQVQQIREQLLADSTDLPPKSKRKKK